MTIENIGLIFCTLFMSILIISMIVFSIKCVNYAN